MHSGLCEHTSRIERESALAKSREQRLADERDYKRRRKTYRTKSGQKKAIEVGHIQEWAFDNEQYEVFNM